MGHPHPGVIENHCSSAVAHDPALSSVRVESRFRMLHARCDDDDECHLRHGCIVVNLLTCYIPFEKGASVRKGLFMAVLIVTEGPSKNHTFSLSGNRVTMIGRDAGCTFQIVDPELSRCHLQIRHAEEENRHFAIDFQSKNGSAVNGQKIEGETLLNNGDVITIGATSMVFSTDDTMDAQRAREAWKKRGQGHLRTVTPD